MTEEMHDSPEYWEIEYEEPQCQVANCDEDATNGVLCERHNAEW